MDVYEGEVYLDVTPAAVKAASAGELKQAASCCGQSQAELVNRPLLLNLPPVDIMAVWDPDNITPALRNFIAVLPELDGTGAS